MPSIAKMSRIEMSSHGSLRSRPRSCKTDGACAPLPVWKAN